MNLQVQQHNHFDKILNNQRRITNTNKEDNQNSQDSNILYMRAFPRTSVLVVQENLAISSLVPSTLVDQVDALLDGHCIDDAAVLVDQRRKKLEGNLTVDPDEVRRHYFCKWF